MNLDALVAVGVVVLVGLAAQMLSVRRNRRLRAELSVVAADVGRRSAETQRLGQALEAALGALEARFEQAERRAQGLEDELGRGLTGLQRELSDARMATEIERRREDERAQADAEAVLHALAPPAPGPDSRDAESGAEGGEPPRSERPIVALAHASAAHAARSVEHGAELARISAVLQEHRVWLAESHERWLHLHEDALAALRASIGMLSQQVGQGLVLLQDAVAVAARKPGRAGSARVDALARALKNARAEQRGLDSVVAVSPGLPGPCREVRILWGLRPILVITFAGLSETYGWFPRLRSLDVNVIHVADSTEQWYAHGCDGVESAPAMIALLRELKMQFACDTVICLGQSMGGYAALKFGAALDADLICAFAPQTRRLTESTRYKGRLLAIPEAAPDVVTADLKGVGQSHIFVSASEDANPPDDYFWSDHEHIDPLRGAPGLHVHVVDGADHVVTRQISRRGKMDQVLESMFALAAGQPTTLDLDHL